MINVRSLGLDGNTDEGGLALGHVRTAVVADLRPECLEQTAHDLLAPLADLDAAHRDQVEQFRAGTHRFGVLQFTKFSSLPLCTSAVVTAVAAYHERRARQRIFSPSLLFNYRLSRRLSGNPDRNGSHILFSFAAWQRYGLADETDWPFDLARLNEDPPESVFPCAGPDLQYRRLVRSSLTAEKYLEELKTPLSVGIPVVIEFSLHISLLNSFASDVLPIPHPRERLLGDHVALLVGYDEQYECGTDSVGAFRVRNSWGDTWGDAGYGWLPFSYVRSGFVQDSWLVAERTWITMEDSAR